MFSTKNKNENQQTSQTLWYMPIIPTRRAWSTNEFQGSWTEEPCLKKKKKKKNYKNKQKEKRKKGRREEERKEGSEQLSERDR